VGRGKGERWGEGRERGGEGKGERGGEGEGREVGRGKGRENTLCSYKMIFSMKI